MKIWIAGLVIALAAPLTASAAWEQDDYGFLVEPPRRTVATRVAPTVRYTPRTVRYTATPTRTVRSTPATPVRQTRLAIGGLLFLR